MRLVDGWFGVCSVILFGWLGIEAAIGGLWWVAMHYILILLLIWAVHKCSITIKALLLDATQTERNMSAWLWLEDNKGR